jgi:hypothetical protein
MFEMENESLKDNNFIIYINKNFSYLNYKSSESLFMFWQWIRQNIKYTNDFYDETLISPRVFPLFLKGDCDDSSLFIKTILDYFGYKTNYIIMGLNSFSHIALLVDLNNEKIYFDGTNENFNKVKQDYVKFKIIS